MSSSQILSTSSRSSQRKSDTRKDVMRWALIVLVGLILVGLLYPLSKGNGVVFCDPSYSADQIMLLQDPDLECGVDFPKVSLQEIK